MKKLVCALVLALSMTTLCSCGSTVAQTAQEENVSSEVAEETTEENESEEAEASEEAGEEVKVEDTKEESEVEAKTDKTNEDETIAESTDDSANADDTSEANEVKDPIYSGLDANVDLTKINRYDKEQKMYMQGAGNVRKGPSTKFDKVAYYDVNTEVDVIGRYEEKGWYLIKLDDTCAFISNSLLGENQVDLEALKAQKEAEVMAQIQAEKAAQEAAAQQPKQEQQAQAPAAAPQAVMPPAGILFIGDSRCVQMKEVVNGGNSSWICEGGKGYDWLMEKALGQADPCVGKGTKVVFCLGVNDTRNCSNYAAIINQKAAEWAARGAKTYFVSVNPVWENPWVTEDQVINFNSSIVGQLSGVKYIDTHSWLVAHGYYLVDGLHYDSDTYVNIFNLIVGSL